MADEWNPRAARRKLKLQPTTLACDALLDQSIFAGVGNIIKNEVLFRIRVHPESHIGALPPRKLSELIKQARDYSFDFYRWKKAFVLKKALAGACQRDLPSLRDSAAVSPASQSQSAPQFLLPAVPAAISKSKKMG